MPCDVAVPIQQPEEAIMVHMVHSVTPQAPEVQEVPRDAKNRKPWKIPGFTGLTMFNPTSCSYLLVLYIYMIIYVGPPSYKLVINPS